MASSYGDWEAVIGLEVHVQLLTQTKLFCGCRTSFGDEPNTHTCPVCLGLPGALPVLNGEAVRLATIAALALGCTVAAESIFARKNYFYPDLPKGYQISQYELPLAADGALDLEVESERFRAGILRVHMEEDAGKNMHGLGGQSVVDYNRAGTPLIEIVGHPDLRSAAQAGEYLRRLREIVLYTRVGDGNLEQGSFRADANVSIRPRGEAKLGTRTELKNINSFRFVEEAIELEIRRQIAIALGGDRVRQQTRGYNSDKKETYLLRDKEGDAGYRYFPEPDLAPLRIEPAFVEACRTAMPELPADKRRRYTEELGLTTYAAGVLTSHPAIATYFEATCEIGAAAAGAGKSIGVSRVANFIQSEILREVAVSGLQATFAITPRQLAELLALVEAEAISGKQAKEVYAAISGSDRSPAEVVRERGMQVMSDPGELERIGREIILHNPKQADAYRNGKTSLLGFFVGQMMKATQGSANPALVNELFQRLLAEGAAS